MHRAGCNITPIVLTCPTYLQVRSFHMQQSDMLHLVGAMVEQQNELREEASWGGVRGLEEEGAEKDGGHKGE